jgi:hypothetical protein
MDSSVRLPGGFRIGVDGLVGLIPGIGDLATLAVSLSIVALAARAGAGALALARMVANLLVDAAIGAVPIVGDLFDFGFKANLRNAQLMESHLARRDGGLPPPER